jgi:recombinational DNA repair protein RecT
VIAAYAVAKLKDGGKQIEVMTKRAARHDQGRRRRAKAKWGPWLDHEEEMQRKTVVRRIAKYLPLTPELSDAFALEDEADRLSAEAPDARAPEGHGRAEGARAARPPGATLEAQSEAETPHDAQTGEVHEE